MTGAVEIDMDSIENINLEGDELQPVLVSHLKSDDFFLVKAFPKAKFTINRGHLAEEPHQIFLLQPQLPALTTVG